MTAKIDASRHGLGDTHSSLSPEVLQTIDRLTRGDFSGKLPANEKACYARDANVTAPLTPLVLCTRRCPMLQSWCERVCKAGSQCLHCSADEDVSEIFDPSRSWVHALSALAPNLHRLGKEHACIRNACQSTRMRLACPN